MKSGAKGCAVICPGWHGEPRRFQDKTPSAWAYLGSCQSNLLPTTVLFCESKSPHWPLKYQTLWPLWGQQMIWDQPVAWSPLAAGGQAGPELRPLIYPNQACSVPARPTTLSPLQRGSVAENHLNSYHTTGIGHARATRHSPVLHRQTHITHRIT